MTKAAVLPVPVRAWASTSMPSRARGNQAGLNRRGLEILGLGQGLEHHGRKREILKADAGALRRIGRRLMIFQSRRIDRGTRRGMKIRFSHEHLSILINCAMSIYFTQV